MNRTGTYVAFDGQGSTDPTESDIHYFNLLKAWDKSGSIDFKFTNSHEKTYQVRDSSSKATLFNRLETRLSASKNFLLIIYLLLKISLEKTGQTKICGDIYYI